MEKLLTKYFWMFNIVTLAVVAYLLASGTSEIAASGVAELLPKSSPKPIHAGHSRPRTRLNLAPADGSDILKRNIFDSVTGPLDGIEELSPDPSQIPQTVKEGGLPIVPCTDSQLKVLATVASKNDISWSFASVAEGGKTRLYRVGDQLSSRTVSGITWRYLFLRGTSDECFHDLFGDGKEFARTTRPPVVANLAAKGKDDIASGIQKISDTERVVDRSVVDKLLADPTQFIRSVRVRPYKKNGKTVGFKLRRFRSNSPLAMLGAEKGDIIHSVNGAELTSVDKALAAYQNLRSAGNLTFSITRKGKPMDLNISIR